MLNLDGLNPAQRRAVECTSGPLLVLAGAGSGKTRVLTYRIAHLIHNLNVAPWNILALTFTNKAAAQMKQRLFEMGIGSNDIWVGTFHSICSRILRINAEKIGYARTFTIYDSDDQSSLVKQCIKDLGINDSALKPNYVKSCISKAKNKFIFPDRYAVAYADEILARKVAKVYARYEEVLHSSNAMDFDDLLINTIRLFDMDKAVREYYQNAFKYIHVDEYQDTNMVQYQFIKQIINDDENICVVGDNDQSIYGWRGADIRNIIEFEKDFKEANVVLLEENYRSTQNILDLANGVIINNSNRRDKNLWSDLGTGSKISYYIANNEGDEAQFVADTIKKGVQNGAAFDDYAILYRTNAQSHNFEYTLRRAGIKYEIVGGLRFYDRKEIKDLVSYLKFIVNPYDEISFRRCINEPKRSIGGVSVDKIVNASQNFGNDIKLAMDYCVEKKLLSTKALTSLKGFIKLINTASDVELLPSQALKHIIDETGYYEELRAQNDAQANARLENIDELMSQIMNYEKEMSMRGEEFNLSTFLQDISLLSDQDQIEDDRKATLLMTIHTAKGLEFKNVFIVGMEENLFPSGLSILYENLEEERRLCYVAITRAMENLYLCRAKVRQRFGKPEMNMESRFIAEMPQDLLEYKFYKDVHPEKYAQDSNFFQKPKAKQAGEHRFKFGIDASDFISNMSKTAKLSDKSKSTVDVAVGDRVRHKFFGEGVVKSIGLKSSDDVVIEFDKSGEKVLSMSAAPMQKI